VKPARCSNVLASMVIHSSVCRYRSDHVDAVPKKRGPKTDVLQTLVKRVDGLEKRLHDDNSPVSPTSPTKKIDVESPRPDAADSPRNAIGPSFSVWPTNSQQHLSTPRPGVPPAPQQQPSPPHLGLPDTVLGSYFSRLHGKPFCILDETSTRQRYHMGQLPVFLSMAIHALTARLVCQYPRFLD
jgi:hypothetical protein